MVVQVSFLLELPMWDVSFDYMHVDKTVHCGCIKLNPFIIYQLFLLLTNEYLQHNKPNPSSFTPSKRFLSSTLSLSLCLCLSLSLSLSLSSCFGPNLTRIRTRFVQPLISRCLKQKLSNTRI